MKRLTLVSIAMFATVFVIGCERSPTSTEKASSPRFSVVPGSGTWTTKASMLTGRNYSSAGVIDSRLYVVGGGGGLNVNEAYDPLTDTWATKAPAPTPRAFAGAGVIAGKLYVAGGCINSDCIPGNTNILEVYDPVANAWTDKAPMPTARNQVGVGVLDGKLYVVGGQGQCGPCIATAVLEVYDPSTDTWATKAPMPTARMTPTVAVANGVLYAVGGAIRPPEPGIAVATVEAYDPLTDTWTSKAAMPTPRVAAAGGVVNDIIYVAGGLGVSTSSGSFLSTVEAYEPIANAWTTMAPMPTARYALVGGVVNNTFYAVTGVNSSSNVLVTNEAFTPPFNFSGFVAPVDNPPIVNVAKAGSAIPVKFSLNGNQGLNILAAGSPSSRTILCDNGAAQDDVTGTLTAGGSSLSYDPAADLYTYVWKTDKTWAGSCRELAVTLSDNTVHKASFKLTK